MSVDVERSELERKDRNDLFQIAEALGEKLPARSRKADIIDRIIQRVGGDAGAGSEGADGRADGSDDGSTGQTDPGISDGSAAAAEADGRPASGDAGANNGGNGSPGGEPGADRQPGQGRRADPSLASNRNDAQSRGQGRQGDQGNRGDEGGGPNQGNRGDQGGGPRKEGDPKGGGNQQDQGQRGQRHQPQRDDEAESGNRRRRRRGRERGGQPPQDEAFQGEPVEVEGMLDLRDEGYGFLRLRGYLPSKDDVYVSVKQVRQFALRKGDRLSGASRPATRNEKNPALLRIDTVNGVNPDQAGQRPRFEDLTPLFPDQKLPLELADDPYNMTARIVDLISPIGKGQRGLIVSPPKAGKTTVMKTIARSVEINNPEIELIVLLVDERPEEVTDMKRWLIRGEVAASTFDRPSDEHTHVSELVIERAKRLVEEGKDVVIILDGITRLARAYNLSAPPSGRIMSGGIDAAALYPPKKFFGAARNIEEGGSLTILATALVETNSRMDEHIFEEFKGTGNMELKLDRRLADRRIYPAIDVDASSTRHEELLFERKQLQQVWKLRRVLSGLTAEGGGNGSGAAGLELLIDRMRSFKNNDEFLSEIAKAPSAS